MTRGATPPGPTDLTYRVGPGFSLWCLVTFAELRKHVLHNMQLSVDWFAESVLFVDRAGRQLDLTVKIESESPPKPNMGRTLADNEVDATERIRVVISRDESWEGGGKFSQPQIGDRLLRGEDVDADRRYFTFAGEVIAFTPLAGTYIFERPRQQAIARTG